MGRGLTRIVAAMILSATGACSSPTPPDSTPRLEPGGTASDTATALLELTNTERSRAGLPKFCANDRLMHAAQLQAEQVADAGRPEHTLRDAHYPTLDDRLAAAGYRWQAAGENLAFGQPTASLALEIWMQSSGHRANVLNAAFTELGTGSAVDPNGRPYYVQVFARPR